MLEERYSQFTEDASDQEAHETRVSPYGGEITWPGVWNPDRRELPGSEPQRVRRPALHLWRARLLACDFGQVAETSCLPFPCI